MPRYSPMGTLPLIASGTCLNMKPMATEMMVIRPSADTDPAKLSHRPTWRAQRGADA